MSTQTKSTQSGQKYVNPIESRIQKGDPASIARDIEQQRLIMEQQMLAREASENQDEGVANPEFTGTVFDLQTHRETVDRPKQIQEISSLIEQIRREVAEIKARSGELSAEVEQVEKATLQSLPDKPGIYHVRYLELMLSFLNGIKAKVGEARTWLAAMQSKKAKRGSAFMSNKQKKGTQYSLSQELSTARNVM